MHIIYNQARGVYEIIDRDNFQTTRHADRTKAIGTAMAKRLIFLPLI